MATHVTTCDVRVIIVSGLAACEDKRALKLLVLRVNVKWSSSIIIVKACTDSAAKMLEMLFIIVHSDIAVASLIGFPILEVTRSARDSCC